MDRVREMEDKPEAVVNAVVSNNIFDAHAFSILSKLPLKSLKRFECVCKSWSHMFENPRFKSMYFNNSTHPSLLLKLDLHYSLVYLLSGVRFETWVHLDFPPPFPMHSSYFRVISSSVNGILCLHYGSNRVVLWNPSTGEFKIVPPSPVEFESPYRQVYLDYKGFGYDHFRDDYKVIRHVEFSRAHDGPYNPKNVSFEPLWEIYSVRSHSWKKLDCQIPTLYGCCGSGVYNDGVCHWWGTYGISHVLCLGSFDLSNEVSFTTPMPSYMGDGSFDYNPTRVQLAVINGSVALISNCPEKTTIEVSILGEVGVKGSWIKLFDIGPLPCIVNLKGVGKNGNIFFNNKDGVLAWFDWSTHMIVDLGLKVSSVLSCQIVTYRENFESLISIRFEK